MHARRIVRNNQATRKKDFSSVTVFYVPSSAFDGANKVYLLISTNTITRDIGSKGNSFVLGNECRNSIISVLISVMKVEEFQFVNKSLISRVALSI